MGDFEQIKAILILDSDGGRIAAKYFSNAPSFADVTSQMQFEKSVIAKVARVRCSEVEVVMTDDYLILVKTSNDVHIILVAGENENEIMLLEVSNAITQGLNSITGNSCGKRQLLEHLDLVLLLIDEVCDRGMVLETDHQTLTNRIHMLDDVQQEQSFQMAFSSAKEQVLGSLLNRP